MIDRGYRRAEARIDREIADGRRRARYLASNPKARAKRTNRNQEPYHHRGRHKAAPLPAFASVPVTRRVASDLRTESAHMGPSERAEARLALREAARSDRTEGN